MKTIFYLLIVCVGCCPYSAEVANIEVQKHTKNQKEKERLADRKSNISNPYSPLNKNSPISPMKSLSPRRNNGGMGGGVRIKMGGL